MRAPVCQGLWEGEGKDERILPGVKNQSDSLRGRPVQGCQPRKSINVTKSGVCVCWDTFTIIWNEYYTYTVTSRDLPVI